MSNEKKIICKSCHREYLGTNEKECICDKCKNKTKEKRFIKVNK